MSESMEKKLYDLEEARKVFPVSRAAMYKLCAEGVIPTVRLGRRVFIPRWWVDKMTQEPTNT